MKHLSLGKVRACGAAFLCMFCWAFKHFVALLIDRMSISRQNFQPNQIWRIMRLTGYLVFVFCLNASANGHSQTVSLKEVNVPIVKVFKEIERQTGYVFLYEDSFIKLARPVTVEFKHVDLKNALRICFTNQPISFEVLEKVIVIKPHSIINKEGGSTTLFKDLRGRVQDDNGKPIPNATVQVIGGTNSTITNEKGEFVLMGLPQNARIAVSCIGFDRQIILVNNQVFVTVTMPIKINSLDETIVLAYGTTTKRFNTGSIVTVKADKIERLPISNPMLALQGRVPGLQVVQNNGTAGGPVTLRIQGQNSISNGNDPLVIVDGMPYPTTLPRTGQEGAIEAALAPSGASPLAFINSADIERIEVLKDADATSIYGSRAANGAIIITTKRGESGPMKININIQHGFSKMVRRVKMLNTREYLDMRYEANNNDMINWRASNISANDLKEWDTTRQTDWQDVLLGATAPFTSANISALGGSSNVQYNIGCSYQMQTSVFPGEFKDNRGAMHFNIGGVSNNKKLSFQLFGNFMVDDNKLPGNDLTQTAVLLEPIAPELFNEDGELNWALDKSGISTWNNPLVPVLYYKYSNRTKNLISSLNLNYRLLPFVTIMANLGYNSLSNRDFTLIPIKAYNPEIRANGIRSASFGDRTYNTWSIEPQIEFRRAFKKYNIEIIGGSAIQQTESDSRGIGASGFSNDESLLNPAAATSIVYRTPTYFMYKYSALFGRANLRYSEKYILSINGRRDGSSRFGSKSMFHNFGSIGLAWILSEEKFFRRYKNVFSFAKIRGSYGTTGSDQISNYSFLSLYSRIGATVPYQSTSALEPTGLANPNLQWEETKKLQVGVEVGAFKDRILFTSNFARNRSSNQLIRYNVPAIVGFTAFTGNFDATVQNVSAEFLITASIINRKNFSWSSSFNLTIPKNKLIKFSTLEALTSFRNLYMVGKPLDLRRMYQLDGVDSSTGRYLFGDSKGVQTSNRTEVDIHVSRSGHLKYYGGFENIIKYKGVELTVLLQFTRQYGSGFYFNNGTSVSPGRFVSSSSNQPISVLRRWRNKGDITNVQRFSTNLPVEILTTDKNYVDASFIRLKNVSLSWEVPKEIAERAKLKSSKVYVQGQNVLTITRYDGLDPETMSQSSLPPLLVFTAGVLLTL